MSQASDLTWHGTTILSLRKDGKVVIAGDGQVSFGQTVLKSNAKKLRRLGGGTVLAGFAGATADARSRPHAGPRRAAAVGARRRLAHGDRGEGH